MIGCFSDKLRPTGKAVTVIASEYAPAPQTDRSVTITAAKSRIVRSTQRVRMLTGRLKILDRCVQFVQPSCAARLVLAVYDASKLINKDVLVHLCAPISWYPLHSWQQARMLPRSEPTRRPPSRQG